VNTKPSSLTAMVSLDPKPKSWCLIFQVSHTLLLSN
jgi:hypothetical protein